MIHIPKLDVAGSNTVSKESNVCGVKPANSTISACLSTRALATPKADQVATEPEFLGRGSRKTFTVFMASSSNVCAYCLISNSFSVSS